MPQLAWRVRRWLRVARAARRFRYSPGITVEAIEPSHGLYALAWSLRPMRPLRAPW